MSMLREDTTDRASYPKEAAERHADRLFAEFRQLVQPGMRVLDVGAGFGRFARRFRDAGCEVVTVEALPNRRTALALDGFKVYASLDEFGEWFDLATCLYVLQHNPMSAAVSMLQKLAKLTSTLIASYPRSAYGSRYVLATEDTSDVVALNVNRWLPDLGPLLDSTPWEVSREFTSGSDLFYMTH